MLATLERRMRRRSLFGVLVLLLLTLLVPILAVQGAIYWNWYQTQRQRELEVNLEYARAIGAALDAHFRDLLLQERAIGLAFTSLSPMSADQMNRYLEKIAANYPSVRNLAWIGPDGRALASSEPAGVGVSTADRGYFQEVAAGREWVVTDLMQSRVTDRVMIAVSLGIRDERGALLGVVAAFLDPDRLGEVLMVRRAAGSGLVVADRTGKAVIRYPKVELTWEGRDFLKRSVLTKDALAGKEVAQVIRSNLDGRRRIAANAPVPSIGWFASASRLEEDALRPLWQGLWRNSLLSLCAALAALVVAGLIGRILASNLRRLRDLAAAVGGGEFHSRVPVGGPQEFRELAHSLDRMADELQKREAEKQTLAAAERNALAEAAAAYERAHRALESAGEAFFSFDREWRFTYVNAEAERLLRRRRQDMVGRPVAEFFPEELFGAFYQQFRRAMEDHSPVAFEETAGRGRRWTEVRAYPFEGGLWVYVREIERRKRLEQEREALVRKVQTEHALLEAVLRQMPAGVLIVEAPSGRLLIGNPVASDMLGDLSGFAGAPAAFPTGPKMLRADGRPCERSDWPAVRSLERGETIAGEEVALTDGAGALRTVSVSSAPIRDPDGSIFAVVNVLHDVTERVAAARALRESEERFRGIFESAPFAISILDPEGRIVDANRATQRGLGYGPDGLRGKPVAELLPAEDVADWTAAFRTLVDGKVSRTPARERQYRKMDGSWLWGRESASSLRDADGRFRFAVQMVENVTETKRLQEQLFQAQKMESIGYLTSGIAHDFNNLLMIMVGNTELALSEVAQGSPAQGHLAQIGTAADRAAQLVAQMMAYAGQGPTFTERVNLSSLMAELIPRVKAQIPGNVDFRHEIAEDLPDVEADPAQLGQVVTSLLTNACEAMGESGGQCSLQTSLVQLEPELLGPELRGEKLRPGPHVCVQISDNGCGMDEVTKARIFDPFFTTKFTGRGLGLAAVLGIVRGHGGAIQVDSSPGQGTTVKVFLPVCVDVEEDRNAPLVVEASPETTDGPGEGAILVVDDEEAVRELTETALRRIGLNVLTAADGREAVSVFRDRAEEIAAVLLDMTMPGLDGREVLGEIRRLSPDVPVILASGYSEQDLAALFSGERPTAFVQKPFRLAEIQEVVRRVMAKS